MCKPQFFRLLAGLKILFFGISGFGRASVSYQDLINFLTSIHRNGSSAKPATQL